MKHQELLSGLIDWRHVQIFILYLEYEGGASCYEFRISCRGKQLFESSVGFGSPEPAAAAAFKWLTENDY